MSPGCASARRFDFTKRRIQSYNTSVAVFCLDLDKFRFQGERQLPEDDKLKTKLNGLKCHTANFMFHKWSKFCNFKKCQGLHVVPGFQILLTKPNMEKKHCFFCLQKKFSRKGAKGALTPFIWSIKIAQPAISVRLMNAIISINTLGLGAPVIGRKWSSWWFWFKPLDQARDVHLQWMYSSVHVQNNKWVLSCLDTPSTLFLSFVHPLRELHHSTPPCNWKMYELFCRILSAFQILFRFERDLLRSLNHARNTLQTCLNFLIVTLQRQSMSFRKGVLHSVFTAQFSPATTKCNCRGKDKTTSPRLSLCSTLGH